MGKLEEVRVDSKHRIVLPEEIRRKSGVKIGSKIRVSTKDRSIILSKSIDADEFIGRMEGILKDGSLVHVSDPIKLKEIWAMR